MAGDGRYHHGDLRAALLREAEAELAEKGVEAFSLRGVAKRAGVSHAAPAHHFGDTAGLLTALAVEGFERFMAAKEARMARETEPRGRFIASGLGYIDFALAHPALFRLMFASARLDWTDPALCAAGGRVFALLGANVEALRGAAPAEDETARLDLVSAWAMVHGLSELMISGRPNALMALEGPAREAALREIVGRALPPQ
ncbi:MAG: TetR/AcrR family transcriptional regulator [Pikeienuella sp.]|uniref:TetR/AcrR family transcriptional regulator n=1 Tax=Pikeienuella sp. TaxID=2831957 RepID=UPI00391A8C8C